MCVSSAAPFINPGGFLLSKLPVPRAVSDPAQALIQKAVGKNVITDPTYHAQNTRDPATSAPSSSSSAGVSLDATVPVTDQQAAQAQTSAAQRRALSALSTDAETPTTLKTALGS